MIELTIVIGLLVVFSAAILPNLVGRKRGADIREFYSAAQRMAMNARETAISSNETVYLTFDDAQRRIALSRQETDSDQKMEISHVDVPDPLTANQMRLAGNDVDATQWSIGFYPDGTSDGGGILFADGPDNWSMAIDTRGYVTAQNAELPDDTNATWPAGNYEQRQ